MNKKNNISTDSHKATPTTTKTETVKTKDVKSKAHAHGDHHDKSHEGSGNKDRKVSK